jgi:hypothetical protein
MFRRSLCVLVLSSLISSVAHAQTVPTKPGLWATASEVVINGRKMPTLFDIKGVPQAQKDAMAGAMSQLGLPAGWSPSLNCQTASAVNIQEVMAKAQAQGCTATLTETAGDHVKYKMACKSNAGAASGDGTVTGIGSNQVKYVMNLTGTTMGKPMTYRAISINKYVGPSCANPPAGIDPSWIGR